MLSEEMQDRLIEGLLGRVEQLNTELITEIGKQIKYIGTLTPSQAHKLAQILLYGENVNWIARRLSEVTNLNVREIYQILKKTAIENQEFARQFYKARNIDFIPYEKNRLLQKEVEAIAKLTANKYKNIMNSTAYVMDGKLVPLNKIYTEVVDKAILSVSQGKESYQVVMRKTMNELVDAGLRVRVDKNGEPTGTRVVDYKSGLSRRADTAIRMNTLEGIRTVSNELQRQFGEEYGANMVEVSHHENSAPDHIESIDGRQFARIDVIKQQIKNGEEKEIKLSDIDGDKVKVKGKWYKDFDSVNEKLDRPVSTLNCRHYTFNGILGISKPLYTEEQLEKDKKKNLEGFEYGGKHYTMYEGEQLMRKIETQIRKNKDLQIYAKSSNDIELALKSQSKIKQLTHKYMQVAKISGLKSQIKRAGVSGYRRMKVS